MNLVIKKAETLFNHKTIKFILAPSLFYLAFSFVFQQHYFIYFSQVFNLDTGDGYQNVWNIWWVNHALTQLHASPYFTTMLDWPHGITLIPQTMNIYNGLVGVVLMNLFHFSLVEAVNFAVLSSFVMGGVFMMWFVYDRVGSYKIALLSGFLFTFSSYHFAHAQGHLQLTSLQFVPLFLFFYWRMVERINIKYALLAAVSLCLVMLCDYYYLLWCVVLGAGWILYDIKQKPKKYIEKKTLLVVGLFGCLSAILTLPLLMKLSWLSKHGNLTGQHDPLSFSLDPVTVFIPGGANALGQIFTIEYWTKLPYMAEMSVYFGLIVIVGLLFGAWKMYSSKKEKNTKLFTNNTLFWWIVLIVFGLLALGPRLRVSTHRIDSIPMPYAWLEAVWPTLQISGMPVRWIFISHIAAIVILAFVLKYFVPKKLWKNTSILIVVGVIMLVDILPTSLPQATAKPRDYVIKLKQLPKGAVIDNAAISSAQQLFHQTVHEKPMAFGYTTRSTREVDDKNFHIFAALEEGRHQDICQKYKIRYITTPSNKPLKTTMPVIYQDSNALIYDFRNSTNCEL